MPESEQRPEKLISYRFIVNRAIFDFNNAVNAGRRPENELETLDNILSPYYDRKFKTRATALEKKFRELDKIPDEQWPHPRKPTWTSRYFRLLLELAKRKKLLDITEMVDW